jgi:ATP-dependent DNA helicase RecG
MNDAELEQLLDDIESDRAERTESIIDGDKFRQAVRAFVNDLPDHRTTGVLFVGVNNKGEPTGIKGPRKNNFYNFLRHGEIV